MVKLLFPVRLLLRSILRNVLKDDLALDETGTPRTEAAKWLRSRIVYANLTFPQSGHKLCGCVCVYVFCLCAVREFNFATRCSNYYCRLGLCPFLCLTTPAYTARRFAFHSPLALNINALTLTAAEAAGCAISGAHFILLHFECRNYYFFRYYRSRLDAG